MNYPEEPVTGKENLRDSAGGLAQVRPAICVCANLCTLL